MYLKASGLRRRQYQLGESAGLIISDSETAIGKALSAIELHRERLNEYVRLNPFFEEALEPVELNDGPLVARLMAEHSAAAGVGPMAAVAGVLADLAIREMVEHGARVAVVENGGEAAVVSEGPVDVALQAGDEPLSRRIGFRLERFPVGVATSSGRFSHALSFGDAEAVTVFADNAGLADAAATAVGNVVKGDDEESAARLGVEVGLSIEGVQGVFVVYKGAVGVGGRVPKIIAVDPLDSNGLSVSVGGA
jgi:ApbE superfamily uncharacterized protein (UPF0280 family)